MEPPKDQSGFFIRVIKTRNVDLFFRISVDGRRGYSNVFLKVANVADDSYVPQQGELLIDSEFEFADQVPNEERFSRETIGAIEGLIGAVPVASQLYDIVHFIYAASTGKDFYGWNADQKDVVILGFAALLSFLDVLDTRAVKQLLGPNRDLDKLLDDELIQNLDQVMDPDLREALRTLPAADANEMTALLVKYLKGDATLLRVAGEFDNRIHKRMIKSIGAERLDRVFSGNFEGFVHADLSHSYNLYRSKGGKSNPVDWAANVNVGKPRRILVEQLGDDYAKLINAAKRTDRIPVVTPAASNVYERILRENQGIAEHQTIVELKRQYGHLFESDHLLEMRFIVRSGVSIDENVALAMMVPKNAAVASQLKLLGHRFYYHHLEKTRMMRQLIPHEFETAFNTQQWWDAHVFVFESLGVPDQIIKNELKTMFKMIDPKIKFRRSLKIDHFKGPEWLSIEPIRASELGN